jgi:hypothetical protein
MESAELVVSGLKGQRGAELRLSARTHPSRHSGRGPDLEAVLALQQESRTVPSVFASVTGR